MTGENAVTRYGLPNADLVSGYFVSNKNSSISCPENGDQRRGLPGEASKRRGGAAAARPRLSLQKRTGGGQRERAEADA
jgi:hypothetical protein